MRYLIIWLSFQHQVKLRNYFHHWTGNLIDAAGCVSCINLFTETDLCFEWCVSLTTTGTMKKVQGSKLFSGVPWPIIFKPETTPLGHLTCYEWPGSWSCLEVWSTDSEANKTFFELHFHIPSAVLFYFFGLKIIGHENPDSNLESLSMSLKITSSSQMFRMNSSNFSYPVPP
jgi:hypothetical protein